MDNKAPKTVGKKEGVGAGIIAIGIVLAMLPGISQQIADFDFVASSAFGIMTGAVYVFGLFTLIAGAVVTFTSLDDDVEIEEE